MRSILRQYATLSLGDGGPASPALNEYVTRRDGLLTLLAASTLSFECVCVPAAAAFVASKRVTRLE